MRHDTYDDMHNKLKNIILNEPHISESAAKEEMWESLQSDAQRYFRLLFDNWFNTNWQRYEPKIEEVVTQRPGKEPVVGHSITVVRTTHRASRAEMAPKRKIVAKKVLAKVAHVVLMNLPMPNGKLLRDCTGAECSRFGGWLAAIGKVIKPTQKVGANLSETDLQNIFGRNQKRAA